MDRRNSIRCSPACRKTLRARAHGFGRIHLCEISLQQRPHQRRRQRSSAGRPLLPVEWGPMPEDRRLAVVINHSYELPFGVGRQVSCIREFWRRWSGNWTVTGIWSALTGDHVTPTLSTAVTTPAAEAMSPARIGGPRDTALPRELGQREKDGQHECDGARRAPTPTPRSAPAAARALWPDRARAPKDGEPSPRSRGSSRQ